VTAEPKHAGHEEVLNTERTVLRALCTGALRGSTRRQVLRLLEVYSFRDVIHQLIFDAVREIKTSQAGFLRQELPARLTQKGFPEVDFDQFLEAPGLGGSRILELAARLRAGLEAYGAADDRQ